MNLVRKFGEGLFWGAGFSIALMLVFLGAESLDLNFNNSQETVPDVEVSASREKIVIDVKSVVVREGRVIVSALLTNNNPSAVTDVWLDAIIFDGDQAIDHCNLISTQLKLDESKLVPIFCRSKWESLNSETLRAIVEVDRLEVWRDGK